MKALFTAIMTNFNALVGGVHNDFWNDIQGRLFRDQALQNTDFPYAVFKVITSTPQWTFKDYLRDTILQLDLFSLLENPVSGEIENMFDHQKALFDDQPLTISGNTFIWMHEINLVTMVEEIITPSGVGGVKYWTVDYTILSQKS